MKKLATWVLAVAGTISFAVSLALIYPAGAMASCTITVNCPGGGIKQCSGDYCESSNGGNGVTCTIHGKVTPESGPCEIQ